ncbi:PQQ-binding-like beta-propeller repeat protein [soil metagenome]
MTSSPISPPRRSFFRTIAPFLIIGIGAAVIIGVWTLPLENLDKLQRVLTTNLTILLGVLLLAAWMIFLSGWTMWVRMGVLVCAAVVIMGSVKKVTFTGDMRPVFQYRWENPIAHLEEQRANQKHLEKSAAEIAPSVGDYAEYRGVKRDGVVAGPALAREWKTPPRELWRQPVGGGFAGFVVQGSVAVTIEQRRDREAIVCYDTATGTEIWAFSYPADFQEAMGGPGPRATPTIAGDEVFSLGAVGDLVCLDLKTGKKKWNVNVLADNTNIIWAMSGSPLVYENMVVVNPGAQKSEAQGKALRAYDRSNGKLIWASGDTKAGYSSPMLATLAGKQQILLFDADCVAGYDPKTGTRLWKKDWPGYNGVNVAQPLVLGDDRLFISRSYDVGAGAVIKISEKDGKWEFSEPPIWENKYLRCKFTSPVLYQDHIYGLDEGILVCLDAKTGKRKWRGGRYGHGQILLTGDLILVLAEDGKLVLVQATPEAHRELGSIRALPGDKTWNHLALARGVAYLRNHEEMVAYELPLAEKK